MVDSLRRDLIQVARRCEHIQLGLPEINKILNGKYQQVIDVYVKNCKPEPVIPTAPDSLDEIAVAPAPNTPEPTENTEYTDEEWVEAPKVED